MRILLANPEAELGLALAHELGSEHALDVALDGRHALELARARPYSLCLLDKELACRSGACRMLLEAGHAPYMLMLSHASGLGDRLACLDCGADDHLFKPVDLAELVARIRAAARRLDRFLVYGDLKLDRITRQLTRRTACVELTNREFELLTYFMGHPDRTLSRDLLSREVWRISFETRTNLVDVYVNYLRRKLAQLGVSLIRTVRGQGYRFGFAE